MLLALPCAIVLTRAKNSSNLSRTTNSLNGIANLDVIKDSNVLNGLKIFGDLDALDSPNLQRDLNEIDGLKMFVLR